MVFIILNKDYMRKESIYREKLKDFICYYKGFPLYHTKFFRFILDFLLHFITYKKSITLEKSYTFAYNTVNFQRWGVFLWEPDVNDILAVSKIVKQCCNYYGNDFLPLKNTLSDFRPILKEKSYIWLWFAYNNEDNFRLKIYFSGSKTDSNFFAKYLYKNDALIPYIDSYVYWIDFSPHGWLDKKSYYVFSYYDLINGRDVFIDFLWEKVYSYSLQATRLFISYKRWGKVVSVDFWLYHKEKLLYALEKDFKLSLLYKGIDIKKVQYISFEFDIHTKKMNEKKFNFYYE